MRIFFFEIRKNFLKRSIFFALILFSVVNIIKIYNSYSIYGQFPTERLTQREQAYNELYEKLRGEMTV